MRKAQPKFNREHGALTHLDSLLRCGGGGGGVHGSGAREGFELGEVWGDANLGREILGEGRAEMKKRAAGSRKGTEASSKLMGTAEWLPTWVTRSVTRLDLDS